MGRWELDSYASKNPVVSSVQSLSCVQLFVTPWTEAHQASLPITNSRSLLKFMSIESVMPSNHLNLCHPLLLLPSIFTSIRIFSSESTLCIKSMMPSNHLNLCHPFLRLPSIFPSIRIFAKESVLYIRWPRYWSFSFNISPSNEYSGLISFRIDWFELLAVQGILNSLLQHHSSEASILWSSALFMVQLSHPYMITGKTIAWLDRLLSAK